MRWKHRTMTAAFLALVAMAYVSGQTGREVFPFPVTTFELDNGLKVVGVDYDSPGIVAYYTVVRTGSRNEVEPGFSGYAHFFEHMMFRGHREVPDRGLQRSGQANRRRLERLHHQRLDDVLHRRQLGRAGDDHGPGVGIASGTCSTARTISGPRRAPSSASTT